MDCLRFKAYLVQNKIKQSDIADILKITQESANAKINGRQNFTLEQVKILCEYFGISADDYFI